jgi:transposase
VLITAPARILVATAPIDFRKSIDGIAALVDVVLRERPLSGTMFVFSNRRRDSVKLLVWDRGGFVLIYKKLERGRFRFPMAESDRLVVTPAELAAILEGIDLGMAQRLSRWNPHSHMDG